MCGNPTCPLAWRERQALRALCGELMEEEGKGLQNLQANAGLVMFDVCRALDIDPYVILPADVIVRVDEILSSRPWPTLTEAEHAEMVELENVRVSDNADLVCPNTDYDPRNNQSGWLNQIGPIGS